MFFWLFLNGFWRVFLVSLVGWLLFDGFLQWLERFRFGFFLWFCCSPGSGKAFDPTVIPIFKTSFSFFVIALFDQKPETSVFGPQKDRKKKKKTPLPQSLELRNWDNCLPARDTASSAPSVSKTSRQSPSSPDQSGDRSGRAVFTV